MLPKNALVLLLAHDVAIVKVEILLLGELSAIGPLLDAHPIVYEYLILFGKVRI